MGRVIAIGATFVVLALILAFVVIYFRRKASRERSLEKGWAVSGDLNRREEAEIVGQLNLATDLFLQLLGSAASPNLLEPGELTLLSQHHRGQVKDWLHKNATLIAATNKRSIR